jgi:hypothetical protein
MLPARGRGSPPEINCTREQWRGALNLEERLTGRFGAAGQEG